MVNYFVEKPKVLKYFISHLRSSKHVIKEIIL